MGKVLFLNGVNGMKVIDFQNASCKHCYKCVRNCSVKAISVRHEQAHIMNDHCIHCGKCLEVCPQNAKRFASDLELIKAYIRQNMKIVVSIAPSYLGVMNYRTPGQLSEHFGSLDLMKCGRHQKVRHLSRESIRNCCGKGRIKISLQLAAQV